MPLLGRRQRFDAEPQQRGRHAKGQPLLCTSHSTATKRGHPAPQKRLKVGRRLMCTPRHLPSPHRPPGNRPHHTTSPTPMTPGGSWCAASSAYPHHPGPQAPQPHLTTSHPSPVGPGAQRAAPTLSTQAPRQPPWPSPVPIPCGSWCAASSSGSILRPSMGSSLCCASIDTQYSAVQLPGVL